MIHWVVSVRREMTSYEGEGFFPHTLYRYYVFENLHPFSMLVTFVTCNKSDVDNKLNIHIIFNIIFENLSDNFVYLLGYLYLS